MIQDIYILDPGENLKVILSNDGSEACPILDDSHKEKLNNAFSTYEFEIPADHADSPLIKKKDKVLFQDVEGKYLMFKIEEIWTGRTADGKKTRKFYAETVALELLGNIIRPVTLQGVTQAQALDYALAGTRFERGVVDFAGSQTFKFTAYLTTIDFINKMLLQSSFDSELQIRFEFNGRKITRRLVDLIARRGRDKGQIIEYGKNLASIYKNESSKEIYTALIGVGPADDAGNLLTFKDLNKPDSPPGQDWVGDEEARQLYGVPQADGSKAHYFGVYTYSGDNQDLTAEKLYTNTKAMLKKVVEPADTYEITHIDLARQTSLEDHELIVLGDGLNVRDFDLNPEIILYTRAVEVERSYVNPAKNKYVFGTFIEGYTNSEGSRLRDIEQKILEGEGAWRKVGLEEVTDEDFPDVIPAVPSVTATGGFKTIFLEWEFWPASYIAKYEVYGSETSGFAPAPANLLWEGKASGFTHDAGNNKTFYYKVRAVNTRGSAGSFSGQVSASTVKIMTDEMLFGSVTAEILADLAVTAGKLADGSVTTPKLEDLAITNAKIAADAVATGQLQNSAVNNAKLAALAVDAAKLADGAVTTLKIFPDAVTNEKIADLAVQAGQLASGAVIEGKLGDLAVTAAKLAAGAVIDTKIANLAVGNAKLAALAVDAAKLADDAVTNAKIGPAAVNSTEIADSAVLTGKLANLAVDATKLGSGAVTEAKIFDGAVTNLKIGNAAVNNTKLANLAVDAAKLADGAVTNLKLGDSAVTNGKLAALAVDAAKLAEGAVIAGKIANLAVGNAQLEALAVDAAKLASGAVTNAKIGANAVDNAKLANLAVDAAKLADSAVTATKIANLAVGSAAISDAAITNAKLDRASVNKIVIGNADIANAAIKAAQIDALAVGSAAIANLAVTNAKIGSLAVDTAQLADAAITAAKIENLAVGNAAIANLAVTNGKIGNLAVNTAQLADAAITNAKIANLAVGSAAIQDLAVTNAKINDLHGSKISADSITAQKMTITDFTNLAQINEHANPDGNTTETLADGYKYFKSGSGAYNTIRIAKAQQAEFKVGDKYYLSFYGYKTSLSVAFIIRYRYTDGTWGNAGSSTNFVTSTNEKQQTIVTITAEPDKAKTLSYIEFFFEKDGTAGSGFYWARNIELRKMQSAELIVDGAVTADKMAANSITATNGAIANLAVGTAAIADGAITNAKITNLAVTAAKIANLTVTDAQIASLAVTNAKIADLAVNTAEIADAAISTAKIANLAVGNAAIANLAVTNGKIGNLAVDTAQLADAAITSAKIENLAVGTAAIAALAVDSAKIKDLAVGSAAIANLAVTNAKLANLSVGSAQIQDLAVTDGKIANLAVGNAAIKDGAIDNAKITNLYADKIIGGSLAVGSANLFSFANPAHSTTFKNKLVDVAHVSPKSYQADLSGTQSANFSVAPNEFFTISFWAKRLGGTAGGTSQIRVSLRFGNPAHVATPLQDFPGVTDQWQKYTFTGQAPSNASTMNPYFTQTAGDSTGIYVNGIMLNRGKVALEYAPHTDDDISIGSITADKLVTGTITAASGILADLVVTSGKIANLAVGNAAIANLAVTNGKIGNLAVGSAQIADLAVTEAKIANLAIDTAKIKDGAITNAKIQNLDASKITVGTLTGINITGVNISGSVGSFTDSLTLMQEDGGGLLLHPGWSLAPERQGIIGLGTVTIGDSATEEQELEIIPWYQKRLEDKGRTTIYGRFDVYSYVKGGSYINVDPRSGLVLNGFGNATIGGSDKHFLRMNNQADGNFLFFGPNLARTAADNYFSIYRTVADNNHTVLNNGQVKLKFMGAQPARIQVRDQNDTAYGEFITGSLLYQSMSQFSDRKLKENIQPFTEKGINAMSMINDLKVYTFNYKDDEKKRERVGGIHDESPDLIRVDGPDHENNAIDTGNLTWLNTKALQDLIKKLMEKGIITAADLAADLA